MSTMEAVPYYVEEVPQVSPRLSHNNLRYFDLSEPVRNVGRLMFPAGGIKKPRIS